jgi:hypothetical protein
MESRLDRRGDRALGDIRRGLQIMRLFWKKPAKREPRPLPPRPSVPIANFSGDTAEQRARKADSDGTLRRMRQTVEENRLL